MSWQALPIPRSAPCLDNGAVGENDGEIDHPVFHRAVPDRIRPATAAQLALVGIHAVALTCSLSRPCHQFWPITYEHVLLAVLFWRLCGSRAYRWPRIDWEEEARIFDLLVQAHPGYRRLHDDVHANGTTSVHIWRRSGLVAFAYSSACRAMILSIKLKSMLMPPNGAEKLASKLEPPE